MFDGQLFLAAAAIDNAAWRWKSAVNQNGAPVSQARLRLVSRLIRALRVCGAWHRLDDAWLLVAENATQALTSLKQNRLATAVNSPSFSADAGYTFDGSTNYLATGFVPAAHATCLDGSNIHLSVFEASNVGAQTYAMGIAGTNNTWQLRPRSSTDLFVGSPGSANATLASGVTESVGYWSAARSGGASDVRGWKNGVPLAGTTGVAVNNTLIGNQLFIGARNNGGSADVFRASTLQFAACWAPLSDSQEAAVYAALQAYWGAL